MNAFDSLAIDPSGSHLIEASAGTGKTYAIASLYVRLVIENETFKPENILVVTFTEAATKELRDRIRKRLREARDVAEGMETADLFLKGLMSDEHPGWPGSKAALARLDLALQTFDCAAISTIHGFCSRALQENAFESGSLFDTELVSDQKSLIREIADDFWRARFFSTDSQLLPLADDRGWSPEGFSAFLKGKLTNPLLRIVPEFTADEIGQLDVDSQKNYREICLQWKNRRAEIEKIVREHPGLSRNQNCYREDKIPELIDGMDAYAKVGNPYVLFEGHLKLTSGYMKNNRLKKCDPPEDPFFICWDELIIRVNRRAVALHWELLECARKRLPERKSALNVRFFDDLLADLYRALTGPGGNLLAERMRGKYRAALIDEFQDTDQIQYKIFRTVFKEGSLPLFLIGDPKQAIYSFRGADIYAYLEARNDVPEECRHTMALNWRSSGALVEAVNGLFSFNKERPLVIEGLDYPTVQAPDSNLKKPDSINLGERDAAPLQLWFFKAGPDDKKGIIANTRAYPRIVNALTEEIAALLQDASQGKVTISEKPVVAGDIAVIVRGHKQAQMVYDALLSRGIPSVVRSNQSIFQTREALELRTILNALAEPGHEANVRAALATSIMGKDANGIARTFETDGEAEWERCLRSFREYHDLWKNFGFMTMFRSFLAREGARRRLLSRPGGERSVTNLLHCAEVLHGEASASHRGLDALCGWFSEQVTVPPEGEENQIRLESDEKAVKILTIHVSKGLEFPIVFCPFLWGGVIDGEGTVTAHEGYDLVADFGSDSYAEHHRAALNEGLAENVRLLYVALTRAKFRCYLIWGRFRHSESSALAYLLHAPESNDPRSAYQELVEAMEGVDENRMLEKLRNVAEEGRIHLTIDPCETSSAQVPRMVAGGDLLRCRNMSKVIESDWRVTSFSSLIDGHGAPPELPDHDSSDDLPKGEAEFPLSDASILSFPKGAQAGSFLHSIFEKIDFSWNNSQKLKELVAGALERSIYGASYADSIHAMLDNVLGIELKDGLKLSSLLPGSWVQEMEFYFPLKSIDPKLLAGFFRKQAVTSPADLQRVAEQLNFQSVRGMLLGFIDLVFCHDGSYYIVDWKSNHLGYQAEDYQPGQLAREMERKLYPLQYLLYTVAVNRYLERRTPGYRYETHFGGVFYLFLRGIDRTLPGNGVYFDKPDAALVKELSQCLIDFEGI